MFKFNKKNINILTNEIQKIEAIETWMVSWKYAKSCMKNFADLEKSFQAFINKEDAENFRESLENAHKLIGNTYNIDIKIIKQENGL